jgi:hypothetical protein
MNLRNSSAKVKNTSINSNTSIESSDSYTSTSSSASDTSVINNLNKTRKKREELSSNASKIIQKEFISTTLVFN